MERVVAVVAVAVAHQETVEKISAPVAVAVAQEPSKVGAAALPRLPPPPQPASKAFVHQGAALPVPAVPAVPAFSSSLDGAVPPRGVLAVRQEHLDHHLPAAHTTTLQAARLSLALGHQVAAAAAAVADPASTKQLT